jgi:rod shape-determining protein MreC
MDLLLYRYRHLAVLVVVVVAQLGLLAYQVRNDQDVRLIRVWAVGAVTPLASVLEFGRSGTSNFIDDYFLLLNVRKEKEQIEKRLEMVQLDNQRMRAELETAQRAEALALFQKQTPMKTVSARMFMNTTSSSSNVWLDVGSSQGIRKGMGEIKPTGIVGKITAVYPNQSMVLLVNDPLFAAGVVSQKNRVQGTLRGQGNGAIVDFIQNEQTVEPDEWFFTSGSDFIFPRGLRVGPVTSVKNGNRRKEVQVRPSGYEGGLEEVLIILEGVHEPIPDVPAPQAVAMQAPLPEESAPVGVRSGPVATDADRIVDHYRGKVPSAVPLPAPPKQ